MFHSQKMAFQRLEKESKCAKAKIARARGSGGWGGLGGEMASAAKSKVERKVFRDLVADLGM